MIGVGRKLREGLRGVVPDGRCGRWMSWQSGRKVGERVDVARFIEPRDAPHESMEMVVKLGHDGKAVGVR